MAKHNQRRTGAKTNLTPKTREELKAEFGRIAEAQAQKLHLDQIARAVIGPGGENPIATLTLVGEYPCTAPAEEFDISLDLVLQEHLSGALNQLWNGILDRHEDLVERTLPVERDEVYCDGETVYTGEWDNGSRISVPSLDLRNHCHKQAGNPHHWVVSRPYGEKVLTWRLSVLVADQHGIR